MDLLQAYSDSEQDEANEQEQGAAGAAASPHATTPNQPKRTPQVATMLAVESKSAPAPIVLPPPDFDTDDTDMLTASGARKRDIGQVSGRSLVTSPRARPSSRPNTGLGPNKPSPGGGSSPAVLAAGVHIPTMLIPPQARGRANVSVAEEVELSAAQRAAAAAKRKQQQQKG